MRAGGLEEAVAEGVAKVVRVSAVWFGWEWGVDGLGFGAIRRAQTGVEGMGEFGGVVPVPPGADGAVKPCQ